MEAAGLSCQKQRRDIKVDAVRGFGGEVLLHGANFDEAKVKAIELAQQQVYLGAAV